MATSCLDTDLLKYGGTSQLQRKLNALAATYAQVDERKAADLILFAKNYAAYLNYYDTANEIDGNWQRFMNNDPAVIIANIADWPTKDFIPYVDDVTKRLQKETDSTHAKELFKTLFDLVFTLAINLDSNLNKLTDDISFKDYLSVAIASNLAFPLNTLWQYYGDFKAQDIINESDDYTDTMMPVDDVIFSENFQLDALNSAWQISSFTVPGITLGAPADIIPNINIIVTHNLFTGALQSFLNGVIKIVADASAYLNDVLQKYALHQPHYALFVAFLRLFQFAQKKLNNYTQEHLDFYYKNVLQLSNAVATPDFVHLLFELQKNIPDHILKKGTAFKAGKDANNNDLFYTMTDDVVLHDASVQALKSLYLKRNNSSVLYASAVANSEDGNGAKLQSADNSWFAFGVNTDKNQAAIGFAIASNILYLNEGTRIVTITFQCSQAIDTTKVTADSFNGKCSVQFTGKKNWFDPSSFDTTGIVKCNFVSSGGFELSVTIPGSAPAIVPYSSKIHGGNFTQALPMVQLQLTDYATYAEIKKIEINSIKLNVDVTDVKDLVLQNDDGKINAAKPFKLFGEFPEPSSSLIIGSKEIFQKKLDSLTINFTWQPDKEVKTKTTTTAAASSVGAFQAQEPVVLLAKKMMASQPTELIEPEVELKARVAGQTTTQLVIEANPPEISYLFGGEWSPLNGSTDALISTKPDPILVPFSANTVAPATTDFTPNEDYKANSVDGFLRIKLNDNSFTLATYLYNVNQSIASTSVDVTVGTPTTTYKINPPATVQVPNAPAAVSVNIDYTASKNFSLSEKEIFSKRSGFFYHIEPFGYREMHSALTSDKLSLLPVFNLDDGSSNSGGGELWIGLKNAAAAETFSILFQVADGTSDPLAEMTIVNWYYLSTNNWTPFKSLDVTDQTNNLTRSGIVILNIPVDAIRATTRADSSLLWVKAAVAHNTNAICKLITVATNAAKATFLQDVSKNIFFAKALLPNTISKPAVADAAIKKTNQPYPSFDGRVSENDDQFYMRVSERLRHKQRAVTMWDYERLVLQHYPQIHKVKCINHAGLIYDNSNNRKYSETLPGHVTIVTIPVLQNNATANVLKPYTSIGLLTEIQKYLQELTSPFVMANFTTPQLNRLHVINPQFEEVQFDFSVTFTPNHDPTVFSTQLNTDIEQFLSPWAYSTVTDIEFSTTIEKSVVLNFIEERDYVDFVTCFKMNQIIKDDTGAVVQTLTDIEQAVPSTARSILVSYNDGTNRHLIHPQINCDCNA